MLNKVVFKKGFLPNYSDVVLWKANALDIYNATNGSFTSKNNNKVVIVNSDKVSLRNTNIYFSGKNNKIILNKLKNISGLSIACINGSSFTLSSPQTIRGAIVMASHNATISIGKNCLISREVHMYCSGAHALYNLDGSKRNSNRNINIGDRVWIGQGVHLLSGADVGDNSVIGSYSVLAGKISNNCAAAGNPCRVTSKNIFWTNSGDANDLNFFERSDFKNGPVPSFVVKTQD